MTESYSRVLEVFIGSYKTNEFYQYLPDLAFICIIIFIKKLTEISWFTLMTDVSLTIIDFCFVLE